ncbi:COG1834 N-Dimethylarginine dimethylaminohydrolase [uncultured Caudovirales phage]|uniref:COG1834 N-Dimethylarginine dimethylaminohydrolase n=1 Tax=uncultured Caudovirales phage TaxID=2100421 RepID=A0A6J5LBZ2_9CAUD|nr:COG1834 N-Dimethylarginine dimethylaminohydrolase [uncultured Caudovirales phage]
MISSFNEWDPLKSVVVGSAKYANWPTTDPVFSQESMKTTWKETPVPSGPVPDHIVNEADEDLNELARTLYNLGVHVIRPSPRNYPVTNGMYNYCPRDRLLIYGNTIVDPAMMYPCRDQEIITLEEVTHKSRDIRRMPRDQGMVLDAANVCRLNDTWLYLESDSGNRLAYNWLCEQFPNVKIELVNFYSGVHIDSTIVPLREGLVLLNGSRVNKDNCPRAFDFWDKVYIEDVVAQDFYQYPYASKWIAMNMLVIDPNTVIVDKHQYNLIKILEGYNFTVIPLELRHSRTLGGGFHCVTLDLHRSQ